MRATRLFSRLLPLRPATITPHGSLLRLVTNPGSGPRRCQASLAGAQVQQVVEDDIATPAAPDLDLDGFPESLDPPKKKSKKLKKPKKEGRDMRPKALRDGVGSSVDMDMDNIDVDLDALRALDLEDSPNTEIGNVISDSNFLDRSVVVDIDADTAAAAGKKKEKEKKEEEEEGRVVGDVVVVGGESVLHKEKKPRKQKEKKVVPEDLVEVADVIEETVLPKKRKKAAPKKTMTKKRAPPQEETTEVPEVVEPPQKLVLRDYQEECIKAVLDHLVNYKRLAISLATGAGKTVIFTQLIERVPPRTEQATQTLILVHRRELVEQARIHCQRHYPDKVIEVEMANQVASGLADITLASVQSITSKDRLQKYDPNNFNLILIDECHHAVSETYLKVLGHFGAVSETGPDGEIPIKEDHPIVVGVSATLSRHDGLALAKILDYLVYHKSYVDMIGDKHLSNVSFTTVRSEVDLSQVRATGGDFNISDLSAVVNTEEANEVTVRAWMEKAVGRKSTLVFCVDIAHVEAMTNKFRLHGIDAQYVTSLSGNAERAEKLARFRAGEFPVLVNCGIYTEGTDIPNIDCIVLARPTRSRNLLIQMIGRGMRLSPATGKENCHIIDMVGVIQKGIVTTPTLFGLDPSTILKDKKPEDMAQLAQQQERETAALAATLPDSDENRRQLTIKSVAFTDYDSIYDLLEDTAHDEWVRRISPYAWVKIGFEDYILSSKDAMLRVERGVDKTYTVTETSGSTWSTFLQQWVKKKPQVLSHDIPDLEHAIRGADSFAAANYPQYLILHSAPWRKAPATEAQIKQLYKMRPEGDWERKRVTKGQAADIQTRVKFGRAKWEKVMKLGQRMKEKAEKAESTAGGRAGGIVSDEIVVGRIADMVAMKRKSNMEEVEQELETEMEMEMETEKEEERLPSSEEKEKKRTAIDGDVWVPRVGDGWKGKWVRDEFA